MTQPAARLSSPSTARNREPIGEVLRQWLPASGAVLEIAAGAGEHAAAFAAAFPALRWQPSDADPAALASIEAWRRHVALPNLLPPIHLDVAAEAADWPQGAVDAIVCINMVHISPWAATEGLISGAGRLLGPGGVLYLYGPYREADVPTAASNAAFDASLRSRNPAWGLRDLQDVTDLAANSGLDRVARISMPANNLSLVFRRR